MEDAGAAATAPLTQLLLHSTGGDSSYYSTLNTTYYNTLPDILDGRRLAEI